MDEPQHFGKYRIDRRLGAGAFATVWLAHDDILEDAVAIKVLSDNWSINPDVRRRFMDEAKIMRQLDYDHGVVRVHAIDVLSDGRPYFVMTYADRGTLQDRQRAKLAANTTFSLREAIGYALDIVNCLEVVHDYGIVHRDIKPSNVLFRSLKRHERGSGQRDDRLMLGDFGLAKDTLAASGFTLAAGTPAYMAPEQARASTDLDHRADLFSVVAVLYELVAGRAAFSATRLSTVGESASHVPSPLSSLRDRVPASLELVVMRGLEIDRERRFQSGAELGAELRQALADVHDDDMPMPAERSRGTSALGTHIDEIPGVPNPLSMTIALVAMIVEQFGPTSVTALTHSRATNPARLVVAAGTAADGAAASALLIANGFDVALVVDPTHVDSAAILARADVVIVVPRPGVNEAVAGALKNSFAGPVVVAALLVDAEPMSTAPFAAVAPASAPFAVVDVARAALVDNGQNVRVSGALCELERELTYDPSPLHTDIWHAVADRVDGMRLAHPQLVELDVLRAEARGALLLPQSMRVELRRLVLGSSPLSRLGLESNAPISVATAAAEEALMRWRGYLGSDRAPFASRGAVGTIARSLERIWLELTGG